MVRPTPGLRYVRQNLDFLVIKPAFPARGMEPVFGGRLGPAERSRLLGQLETRPNDFVGQELLQPVQRPGLVGRQPVPRRVVLRVYIAAAGDSWIVMPGGLTRVSPSADTPVVSMQHGGGSKDTWVLSSIQSTTSPCAVRAICRWNSIVESAAICPAVPPNIFSG